MHKLMIPVALALAALLAGCGKNDSAGGSGAAGGSSAGTAAPSPAAAPAPATAPAAAPAAAPGAGSAAGTGGSSTMVAGAAAGGPGGAAAGQQVYAQTCVVCHGTGVTGAPKLGDKADWSPRLARGKDTLYSHAIGGYQGTKGLMPPKGGNAALPDEQVKAAVDYMVSQAQ